MEKTFYEIAADCYREYLSGNCAVTGIHEVIAKYLKQVSEEAERRSRDRISELEDVRDGYEKQREEDVKYIAHLEQQLAELTEENEQNKTIILYGDENTMIREQTKEIKKLKEQLADIQFKFNQTMEDRSALCSKLEERTRERDEARKSADVIARLESIGGLKELNKALDHDRKGFLRGVELSAKTCQELPIDKARCRVLMLTEQAWEEGQDSCTEAILKLKLAEEGKC